MRVHVCALLLAALSGAAAGASEFVPAFAWNMPANAPKADHYGEVSAADVERVISSAKGAEVHLIFLAKGLDTEAVRAAGYALPAVEKLLKSTISLTLPFTTTHHSRLFDRAPRVQAAEAEAHFQANPTLFSNGVPDVVVIQLQDSALAAQDALIARITRAVEQGTRGKYAALLTADTDASAHARRLSVVYPAAYLHTGPTLLTAQLVCLILFVIFMSGFCCLFNLQTPKRFNEDTKAS